MQNTANSPSIQGDSSEKHLRPRGVDDLFNSVLVNRLPVFDTTRYLADNAGLSMDKNILIDVNALQNTPATTNPTDAFAQGMGAQPQPAENRKINIADTPPVFTPVMATPEDDQAMTMPQPPKQIDADAVRRNLAEIHAADTSFQYRVADRRAQDEDAVAGLGYEQIQDPNLNIRSNGEMRNAVQ